jgi:uroporphyrin-III C-methyltransferase
MAPGSLTFVGTGIAAAAHLTAETRIAIEAADEVLYVVTHAVGAAALERLNPNTRSLRELYREGVPRSEIYSEMARQIVGRAQAGKRVCAAFYGHPAVLARPAHEARRLAIEAGIEARMLPAVSALDCLFADLGVDPGAVGLQSYEATEFLTRARRPDLSAALVLWQLHLIGQRVWGQIPADGLVVLAEYLLRWYPRQHGVVVYEASPFPSGRPSIDRITLGELANHEPPTQATLYVPPAEHASLDRAMVARLAGSVGAISPPSSARESGPA